MLIGNRIRSVASTGVGVAVCAVLVAAPWLWPVLAGPLPAMWPDLFAMTMGALLFVLLPNIRPKTDMAIASGWMLAAVVSAVLALLQYFDLEDGLYPFVGITLPGNAFANVFQTNLLATLLSVGLLSIWWLNQTRHLSNVHASLAGFAVLVALAATTSRTGTVHLILIATMTLYWQRAAPFRWLLVVLSAFVVYMMASVLLPRILDEVMGIVVDRNLLDRLRGDAGCSSRSVIWTNVIQLISLKPWAGWGGDGLLYAHYITPFEGARYCEKMSNAHNLFLQVAVERGIPAALILVGLCIFALIKLKPWAAQAPTECFAWGVLLLIAFHSMVEYPMWFGVFQLMTALAIWLIWVERHPLKLNPGGSSYLLKSTKSRLVVSSLLLAALAFVAWDYFRVSQLYTPPDQRAKRYQVDVLNQARQTMLFQSHVLISQIVVTEVKPENAQQMLIGALEALHVAPDSRIIRKVIEAAQLLGRQDLVQLHTARYKAAWPKEFEEWVQLSNSR